MTAREAIPTYTVGQMITAAHMNKYIRDNEAAHWEVIQGIVDSFAVPNKIASGRLTLLSGNPVTFSNQSAKGTVYYTPYNGNIIALYDGTGWNLHEFTELSLTLTATSGKNYDIFLFDNSGVLTLSTEVWTDDSTRATAIARQDGVPVKSGAATYRYLGTIRATGTNQTSDTASIRGVWNFDNRVKRNCLYTTDNLTADQTLYWINGDPAGENVTVGIGGSWTAAGSGNFAACYLYSTLIPSSGNGHGEVGCYGLSGMVQTGKTWSLKFSPGYNYALADLKLYNASCKAEYVNIYVELWN